MLIFSYGIKHNSTNMNKILYKLFYVLLDPYNTKGLPFMNLNKLDVKNKNTNLYCIFYILFIRNQRKN
jgi:hypothetical protein